MKLKKKALLYDIANIAYVIADTGEHDRHILHQVRDICEEGNIDRVSRVLGLAYSQLLTILLPVITTPPVNICRDASSTPHDYEICFSTDGNLRFSLTKEKQLNIKETCHEYMVCMVLADCLSIHLPVAADVWKYKAQSCLEALSSTVASVVTSSAMGFRRRISPL